MLLQNCHQVIYKKDAESPKKCNELSADDVKSFKSDDKHAIKVNLTTPIPEEKTNCTSNSESIKIDTTQESNKIKQDEHKYIVNVLQMNNSDIANLQSQDEKLISKIVSLNNMHIMPNLNSSQINTQQYMELHKNRSVDCLQPSQAYLDISKMETIRRKNSNNEIDLTQSDTEELEDAIDYTTIKVNIDKPKIETVLIDQDQDVESSISIQCPESPETNLNSNLSQDQDPEIISFRAMCDIMLENKPTIGSGGVIRKEVVNDIVLGFKQVNENVMSVDFMGCVQSTSKFNSVCDLTNIKSVSRPLAHKRQVCSCKSSSVSDESSYEYSNGSLLKRHAKRRKRPKYSLSRSKLNVHSKSRSSKPSNTVYLISTSSEDDEDCVLVENKTQKDQVKTKIKEIKPIFTCSPNGQIHKDMLTFMNTNNS